MKIDIKGASNFVNRMFEACGNFQWAREFLKNSLEAGATRVEFGIEWQAVQKLGTYRRIVADNGHGMSAEELLNYFKTLGAGGKKIGGVHDNFGVGAKIASLPWNPNGLVVISHKDSQASMIWIFLDEDSQEYELAPFETEDGSKTYVIDPNKVRTEDGIAWGNISPEWIQENGTVIVLLGSDSQSDTILGNPDANEADVKGLSLYLNTRFWDLSETDIKVVEVRSNKKTQWPQDIEEKDDARRPNNRTIKGARHFLTELKAKEGNLAHTDVSLLGEEKVMCEWYLWDGKRPDVHTYAKEIGYIAIRYNGELFHLTSSKVDFRHFGIIESAVQRNLTLILEPQHYNKLEGLTWGIHPDQSRNQLIFTGNREKGVQIPLVDWGTEFASKMPDPIHDAIRKARSGMSGSIEDDDYRKRLQDRFGRRWTMEMLVEAITKGHEEADISTDDIESVFKKDKDEKKKGVATTPRKQRKAIQTTNSNAKATNQEVPVDIPRYQFANQDDFEEQWHLAMWAPTHTEGPTVFINLDSPILEESVQYHLAQYPDVYAEEVTQTVQCVFGELAACKIAHSQMLKKHIPEQDLDNDYRNEKSLTVALMGLLAEESVIAHRLKRLGQRRTISTQTTEQKSEPVATKS